METISSQDIGLYKDFDIEEVSNPSDSAEKKNTIRAGKVEVWKRVDAPEKTKLRPYITSVIISLWAICIIVGLIRWTAAGDISLLISSPVLVIGPLHSVIKFYFKE